MSTGVEKNRNNSLEEPNSECISESEAESCSSSSTSASQSQPLKDAAERKYDKILKRRQRNRVSNNDEWKGDFEAKCRTLRFTGNVKPNESALQFWERRKAEFPDFYRLAQIVFGAPGTQVSVERLFSLLNYLLAPRRYQLKDSTINKILFLKSNLDVLLKLKNLIIVS